MQNDAQAASASERSRATSDHSTRLAEQIRDCVAAWDRDSEVQARIRPDGKLDLTVISRRFEGLDSREREAEFWVALDPVPEFEMVFLTYGLLLTPQEAEREFSEKPVPSVVAENWDE
jgi:hypothetical protein